MYGSTLAYSYKDLSSYRQLDSVMRRVLVQRFNGLGNDRKGHHGARFHQILRLFN